MKIVTKGYYKVIVNGLIVSQHREIQKAIESLINTGQGKILFPDEMILEDMKDNEPSTPILNNVT